ncbi:meprin A subunit beta-like [Alosa pseudoharengus]|uniref:meprin A subunit beta-like n=1 Tax=Alosa pseudoharengus TaxID=34774 RepID=UPI003F894154
MYVYIWLVMTIAGIAALSLPQPEEIGIEKLDITQINKDLNMREGDIKEVRGRSSLLGQQYRWDLPVPYVLDAGLDINAKGVILKAFEQFRLKTCIDFTSQLKNKADVGHMLEES